MTLAEAAGEGRRGETSAMGARVRVSHEKYRGGKRKGERESRWASWSLPSKGAGSVRDGEAWRQCGMASTVATGTMTILQNPLASFLLFLIFFF